VITVGLRAGGGPSKLQTCSPRFVIPSAYPVDYGTAFVV
jgi:hypothetical protein